MKPRSTPACLWSGYRNRPNWIPQSPRSSNETTGVHFIICGRSCLFPLTVHAQQADRVLVDAQPQPELGAPIFPFAKDYQPAPDIVFRVVSIISEGVRLHAELFYRKDD